MLGQMRARPRMVPLLAALTLALLVSASAPAALAQSGRPGGVLRVATIGEPPMLDIMSTTATITSNLAFHWIETLFAFDANWTPQPFLVEDYWVTDDGLTYVMNLRRGVKFHNGKEMTAEDVVASVNRWRKVSVRGQAADAHLDEVIADGDYTVIFTLKEPFSPLPTFLAFENAAAGIYPKEVIDRYGDNPIQEHIGTGPYRFVEWLPDRHIRVARFEGYQPHPAEPSGFWGRREALIDEILFIPVPEVATRVAGVQSGDFDFAESVDPDTYDVLASDPRVVTQIVRPFAWPVFFFNHKEGIMTNPDLRRAVLAALDFDEVMFGGFGSEVFYDLEHSFLPEGAAFYNDAGRELYYEVDLDKARRLAQQAGYNGEPIRWLVSPQYHYHLTMTQVAGALLEAAGFNVELQVYDWATLIERRGQPDAWDMFTTHHNFVADPTLITFLSESYPGWWVSERKNSLLAAMNKETDLEGRAIIWGKIQEVIYDELPAMKPGEFYALDIHTSALKDYQGSARWFFWNAWLDR